MNKTFSSIAYISYIVVLFEVFSFFAGTYLKSKGVFYNSAKIENYDQYLRDRDGLLGWPSKKLIDTVLDQEGSRKIPTFPDSSQNSCASMYGDSFTWGEWVQDNETVPNYLSEMLGCRVSNFGVSGYGTDQMLLRFKNNKDEAPVVILNHFSEDIRRNVSRLRNLLASDKQYIVFKPRFILENGKLSLLPIPAPDKSQIDCYVKNPEKCMDQDYFLPGGNSGINHLKFPYTLSLLGASRNEHILARLSGEPAWKRFYNPDHSSQALVITSEIIKEFVRTAKSENKLPVIVISSNVPDIEYYKKHGQWTFQPLIDLLKVDGIDVINTGQRLITFLGEKDPCTLGYETCNGHLTPAGNKEVAKLIFENISSIVKSNESRN